MFNKLEYTLPCASFGNIKMNNENLSKYQNHKKNVLQLQHDGVLSTLRFSDEYDAVMKHGWLIDEYIAKFGWSDEDIFENTLPAYQKAIDAHHPILIPVQMLDDGNYVCFADLTLARVAKVSGYITKMTLADLKEHKINDTDLTICTLDEVLEFVAGRVPIILDLYSENNVGKFEEGLLEIVEKYIEKYDLLDDVAIMSTNPYCLQWFYQNAPWFPRIIRSGVFKVKRYAGVKGKKLKKLKLCKICNPDYIAYNAKDLPCKYIKKHQPVGVLAYNVKSQDEYHEVAKYCDNIIFDSFEPEI